MIFPNSENRDEHSAGSTQVAENRHEPAVTAEETNSTFSRKEMRKEIWGIMGNLYLAINSFKYGSKVVFHRTISQTRGFQIYFGLRGSELVCLWGFVKSSVCQKVGRMTQHQDSIHTGCG